MPIKKVEGGWKWGNHGKVYANREDAVKQAQAAHANGFEENKKSLMSFGEFIKEAKTYSEKDRKNIAYVKDIAKNYGHTLSDEEAHKAHKVIHSRTPKSDYAGHYYDNAKEYFGN